MKKYLPIIAASMLALAACKKGSVSGTVIDPITGKAVDMPTVYIKGTKHSSQKIPGGLPDGKFTFENVEPGTYTLEAGKNRYSKGKAEFTITKEDKDVKQNIYIYSLEVSPGLYRTVDGSEAEKIANAWVFWYPTCKETAFALRTKFVDEVENPKTKKKEKKDKALPAPKDTPADIIALYKIATSVSSPVEVVSYPIVSSSAKSYPDCGLDSKETLLVPDINKGTKLESYYKSENLYEIKGTLPSGKQFLTFRQDGKAVGLYYLNVK